jgi:tetratricopeptide (TPR) repeat protein
MRSLRKISIAAALAGVLVAGPGSTLLAQQVDEASELNKRVIELYNAGRYADAIPIAQQLLAIREKALGPDHPDVAKSLNNLAALYRDQGRYADALPIIRQTLLEGTAQKSVAFDVLVAAQGQTLLDAAQALADSYEIVQRASASAAASAVSKLAARFAAGSVFDDGLLSTSEIAQLKLNADWVVLSACNTAAEEKPGAEALSGLAGAFFYAGAKSLIVSHWSVSDEATARLMIGTFRASSRDPNLSHAEALRQSMLAMIDAAKSDDAADPRLWALFVVVGEPAKQQ